MTKLTGTVIAKLKSSASTKVVAPPTTTPGRSATFVRPWATSYIPNAKLASVNKEANDAAPTADADHAASIIARIQLVMVEPRSEGFTSFGCSTLGRRSLRIIAEVEIDRSRKNVRSGSELVLQRLRPAGQVRATTGN